MGWRRGRSKVSWAGGSPEGWDVQATCFCFFIFYFFSPCVIYLWPSLSPSHLQLSIWNLPRSR